MCYRNPMAMAWLESQHLLFTYTHTLPREAEEIIAYTESRAVVACQKLSSAYHLRKVQESAGLHMAR